MGHNRQADVSPALRLAKLMRALAIAPALVTLGPALMAQGSPSPIARQQTAADRPDQENYQEIPSPMLLEVSLGSTPKRRSIQALEAQYLWVATETNRFICQQVHIRAIEVRKEEGRGKVRLHMVAVLLAQESPKDVDITLSILSDTKEIRKKFWHDFTADPVTRHPRNPETEFDFSSQEFAALFGPERAPSVRVVLDVKE
jgi:hypothetical protein